MKGVAELVFHLRSYCEHYHSSKFKDMKWAGNFYPWLLTSMKDDRLGKLGVLVTKC